MAKYLVHDRQPVWVTWVYEIDVPEDENTDPLDGYFDGDPSTNVAIFIGDNVDMFDGEAWVETDAISAQGLEVIERPSTVFLAITFEDASGEADATLHATQEAAEQAILAELDELYGDLFEDNPPPTDAYVPEAIAAWCAENLVRFTWSIREKKLP